MQQVECQDRRDTSTRWPCGHNFFNRPLLLCLAQVTQASLKIALTSEPPTPVPRLSRKKLRTSAASACTPGVNCSRNDPESGQRVGGISRTDREAKRGTRPLFAPFVRTLRGMCHDTHDSCGNHARVNSGTKTLRFTASYPCYTTYRIACATWAWARQYIYISKHHDSKAFWANVSTSRDWKSARALRPAATARPV